MKTAGKTTIATKFASNNITKITTLWIVDQFGPFMTCA